jgi:predicted transposase YdaD
MGIEEFLLQRAEDRGIAKGEKRGEKRGEKIGEQRTELKMRSEFIRNTRLKGLSIEFIADIVNLPVEKVRAILDEMGIE